MLFYRVESSSLPLFFICDDLVTKVQIPGNLGLIKEKQIA